MLFNSFSFLIFFPVVVFLYYVLPFRWRTVLLLVASSYFYMAFVPKYILILLFLITVDFFLGKAIAASTGGARRTLLLFSIIANLGTLFLFKYFNFFNENVAAIAHALHWNYAPFLLTIALPLGLSFHVFQSLSYVIEVYRGRQESERSFLTYALYVMFFPQLVAGPIERPGHMLPQLHIEHRLDLDNVVRGLRRMLWGFLKKIVVADNLAAYVDQVYLHPYDHSGLTLLVATVFFAFQIYADFSGYSDIAVGSARVLGFELTENFNLPFLSRSMTEYWRRWHISLSNWLRDYLYYPLALSMKGSAALRMYWALFVTMVLIGLWHGAAWTFVAFGAVHGLFLVLGQMTKGMRERLAAASGMVRHPRLRAVWQTVITFALACAGFVFFRAATVSEAWHILTRAAFGMVQLPFHPLLASLQPLLLDGGGRRHFAFLWLLVLALAAIEIAAYRNARIADVRTLRPWMRWTLYVAATLAIMNLGVTHEIPFIYFQF